MYYECCVCKTSRLDATLHHFPCNEKRLAKWLKCLDRDDLKSLSPERLSKMFVCQKHFEKKFITSKSRLISSAYPSLLTEDEISTGIASHQNDKTVLPQVEHSYSRKRHFDHTYSREPLKEIEAVASTSNEYPLHCLPQYPESSQGSEDLASSSCDRLEEVPQNPPAIQESELNQVQKVIKAMKTRKQLISNIKNLPPSCQMLYKEYKKARKQTGIYKRAKKALKLNFFMSLMRHFELQ